MISFPVKEILSYRLFFCNDSRSPCAFGWFINLYVLTVQPIIIINKRRKFVSSLGIYINLSSIVPGTPLIKQNPICINERRGELGKNWTLFIISKFGKPSQLLMCSRGSMDWFMLECINLTQKYLVLSIMPYKKLLKLHVFRLI